MNDTIHSYNALGHRFHNTKLGKLPGVTTVLGETKDKTFLVKWREKVGEEEAKRIPKEAIDRGNTLHKVVEDTLAGKEVDYSCDLPENSIVVEEMAKALQPLIDTIEPLFCEAHTIHPYGFAGTPDLVGRIKGSDDIILFDWKNSIKPKKEAFITDYYLQLAAYSMSVEYTHGIEVNETRVCVATLYRGKGKLQEFRTRGLDLKMMQKAFLKRLAKYQSMYGEWA